MQLNSATQLIGFFSLLVFKSFKYVNNSASFHSLQSQIKCIACTISNFDLPDFKGKIKIAGKPGLLFPQDCMACRYCCPHLPWSPYWACAAASMSVFCIRLFDIGLKGFPFLLYGVFAAVADLMIDAELRASLREEPFYGIRKAL